MKRRPLAACAALALVAGQAWAIQPSGAKAGLEALNRGDNDVAIRLFTQALLYGGLARSDRELAYVKRAEAFLATGRTSDALADARRALVLNPADAEAIDVRNKSQTVATTSATVAAGDASDALNAKVKAKLDAIEARNRAAFQRYQTQLADYEAKKAAYEAEKRANEDAYAASLTAHQALVKALEQESAANVAEWEKRVPSCRDGNQSQCAH